MNKWGNISMHKRGGNAGEKRNGRRFGVLKTEFVKKTALKFDKKN